MGNSNSLYKPSPGTYKNCLQGRELPADVGEQDGVPEGNRRFEQIVVRFLSKMLTVASFGGWGGGEMDKITKYAAGD
jgi:hypothetical protein